MPRVASRKDESINRIVSEVTLDDFANAITCNGSRLSKGLSFRATPDAHRAGGDGVSWHDDDDQDDGYRRNPILSTAASSSLSDSSVITDAGPNGDNVPSPDEGDTVVYPTDVWGLLSNYIDPYDVCAFAGICHGARRIVRTRGFWRRLYLRYYANNKQLPHDLCPHMLERPGGLVARVVRALHLLCEPLVARSGLWSMPATGEQCSRLEGLRCVSAWYLVADDSDVVQRRFHRVQQPNQRADVVQEKTWWYYFKFVPPALYRHYINSTRISKDSIHYNPEAGAKVLVVRSNHFLLLPDLCGLTLCNAKLIEGLLAGCADRKIKLVFGTMPTRRGAPVLDPMPVQVEPALECHIYPWWHPDYPAYGRP